ncbi:MAG: PilZ domain-containing protein [Thermodesulfobacteriota bacterium]|nr:PilZ domain-containing protein [Thermodesulfobacteriota bacterium]
MNYSNEPERRSFHRVKVCIPFNVDLIDNEMDGMGSFFQESKQAKLMNFFSQIFGLKETPAEVKHKDMYLEAMTNIENKLNLLLNAILAREYLGELLYSLKEIEVSGSGVKWICKEEYNPGDKLGISFVIPQPLAIIHAIGEVLRIEKILSNISKEDRFKTSAKFTNISKESQKQLFKYIFQIDRQQIREKKGLNKIDY